jgi:hypothetical protein
MNLSLLLVEISRHNDRFERSCAEDERLNTGVHLLFV